MRYSFAVIILFSFLSFTTLFTACKKLDIQEELRIDLGSTFNNDYVIVKLDDREIFSGRVTTNHVLGFGEIIKLNYPIGRSRLSVDINGTETIETFRHKEGRFVFITYDRKSSVTSITFPENIFFYD